MSRPRLFLKNFHAQVRPLDYAFLVYYAEKYGLPKQEVLRRIIQTFVDKDASMDVRALARVVKTKVDAEMDDDPALREVLKRQLKEFARDRAGADAQPAQKEEVAD